MFVLDDIWVWANFKENQLDYLEGQKGHVGGTSLRQRSTDCLIYIKVMICYGHMP